MKILRDLPLIVGLVLLGSLLLAFEARGQGSVCLDREKLANMLYERYSERPVMGGLDVAGKLLEVFASNDGSSWTMSVTTPEGTSCVIATGSSWLFLEPDYSDEGDGA